MYLWASVEAWKDGSAGQAVYFSQNWKGYMDNAKLDTSPSLGSKYIWCPSPFWSTPCRGFRQHSMGLQRNEGRTSPSYCPWTGWHTWVITTLHAMNFNSGGGSFWISIYSVKLMKLLKKYQVLFQISRNFCRNLIKIRLFKRVANHLGSLQSLNLFQSRISTRGVKNIKMALHFFF